MMASSTEYFTQVMFQDVQETYSSLSELKCQFTVLAQVPRQSGDYVGIFPVGWKSVNDHVCSQPVNISPSDSPPPAVDDVISLEFASDALPHNDNEFYQFCFVSSSDQRVRGASSPFQFGTDRPGDWELVDEKDSLFDMSHVDELTAGQGDLQVQQLIDTESSHTSEQCHQLKVNMEHLQQELNNAKQELNDKCEELKRCKTEHISSMNDLQVALDDSKQQCKDQENIIEQLKTQKQLETESVLQKSDELSSVAALQLALEDIKMKHAEKETKLQQLLVTLEQHQQKQTLNEREVETYKTDCIALREQLDRTMKQQMDGSIEVEQLKSALVKYQQSEMEWKQRAASLTARIQLLEGQPPVADDAAARPASESITESVDVSRAADTTDVVVSVTTTVTDDTEQDGAAVTIERSHSHDENHDEERFEDAEDSSQEPIRKCPICEMEFGRDEAEEVFASHVEDHVVKICPVCTLEFAPDYKDFVMHVERCIASNTQSVH